jgi:UDP-3-O-[3-hydroxymyristoyl] glucosamine N-acyltransferase
MEFTAQDIASFVGGEIVGEPNLKIFGVSKIEEGKPGTLSFLSNMKYAEFIYKTEASAVLVNNDFVPQKGCKTTLIKVPDAYAALSQLLDIYVQSIPRKKGVESPVFISESAKLGENIYLGAFSYVGENVTIGNNVRIYPQVWIGDGVIIEDDTILYSGVKLYPDTKIGKHCIIHAGAIIGSDGFGFAPMPDGTYKKLHQIGNVVVEDNVEIGANTTIDCSTMGSTFIKQGAKLDNLIQVGHNVVIGENTVMAALTGVAGSSTVGKNCIFAGQVGVAGHLKIGDNVTLGAKTGISNNIPDGKTYLGYPGMEASVFKRAYAVFRNLPELYREVYRLKKETK